jgi:HEAT repeat protein
MALFPDSARMERKGIAHIATVCGRMGYIWRETSNSDVGFDGEIELITEGRATGLIIKVQSRAGSSYIRNEKHDRFDYYADANELEYWKGATNPVILVLYSPKAKTAYWMDVKKYIETHPEILSSRPHRITFDKQANRFVTNAADDLLDLFHPNHQELKDAYRKHIIDRFSKLTLYSVTSDAPLSVDLERVYVKLTATRGGGRAGYFAYEDTIEALSNVHIRPITIKAAEELAAKDTSEELATDTENELADVARRMFLSMAGSSIFATPSDKLVPESKAENYLRSVLPTFSFHADIDSFSINTALRDPSPLVILGGPGAGKTTLLKYLAITFARCLVKEKLGLEEERLPIFVALRDFSRYLDATAQRGELVDIGPNLLPKYIDVNVRNIAPYINLPANFFHQELSQGNCVVLLDGLDEVADPLKRGRVAEAVVAFIRHFRTNRIIVTSRPRGYTGETKQRFSGIFADYSIRDFEYKDMVAFAEGWYEAVTRDRLGDNPNAVTEARNKAADLLRAIHADQRVTALAHNPLLLSVLALVHQRGVGLPQRRAELYSECTDLLLGYWDQTKGGEAARDLATYGELERTEKRALLEPIALWFHERGANGLEADKNDLEHHISLQFAEIFGDDERKARNRAELFLRVIDERAGLLVERETAVYAFAHLTFQEYLAARAIADSDEYIEYTKQHLHDEWWREVILLEVGHLSDVRHFGRRARKLTTQLIENIRKANSPIEDVLKRDLILAARALADVGLLGVDDDLRQAVWNEVITLWMKTPFEAQEKEIVDVFSYALPTEGPRIRQVLLGCLNSEDLELRSRGIKAFAQIGEAMSSDEAIASLVRLTYDDNAQIQAMAAGALSNFGGRAATDEVLERLVQLLMDSHVDVRSTSAGAFTKLADPARKKELIRQLLILLVDTDANVRSSAAGSLALIGGPVAPKKTIRRLLLLTADKEPVVRSAAAHALGNIAETASVRNALDQLITLSMSDDDQSVREAALNSLKKIGIVVETRQAVDQLKALKRVGTKTSHDDPYEGLESFDVSAQGEDVSNFVDLMTLTKHFDPSVRRSAAETLGQIGFVNDKKVTNRLLWMTTDEDETVRAAAVNALAQVSDTELKRKVSNRLRVMLTDSSVNVRFSAACAIGQLIRDRMSPNIIRQLEAFWKYHLNTYTFVRIGNRYDKVSNIGYEELRKLSTFL